MSSLSVRWRWSGLGIALLTAGLATAATLPATSPSQPPPRVATYQARIATYQPRIATYTSRIVDQKPRTTAPSTVTVFSDILFAFDSATLSPQAQSILGQVIDRLDTAPAGQVVVTGYTDSIGDPNYNLQLSQQRATAVQEYLAGHALRSGLTYRVVGRGEADPVAPNTNPDGSDNPSGRAQNRRVTITIPA